MALSWSLRNLYFQVPQRFFCIVAQWSSAAICMAHARRVQCDWHSQGGQLDEQGRNAGRTGHHPDKALGDRHHHGGCNEAQSQRPLDHRSAILLIWPSTSVRQKFQTSIQTTLVFAYFDTCKCNELHLFLVSCSSSAVCIALLTSNCIVYFSKK